MAKDFLSEVRSAWRQYETLVSFVRLKECEGELSPDEAFRLLKDNEYRNYLLGKVPALQLTSGFPLAAPLIRAEADLRSRLLESHPEFEKEISALVHVRTPE